MTTILSAIKYRYFVFKAGLWTKTPLWRLILHNTKKYGKYHWSYWIAVTDHPKQKYVKEFSIDMPEHYVRGMVADWLGASRTYDGKWPESEEKWFWLNENYHTFKLSRNTKLLVEKVLKEAFIRKDER